MGESRRDVDPPVAMLVASPVGESVAKPTSDSYQPIQGCQETNMLKWKPLANAGVIAALIAVYSVLAAPWKW
jgi:hypothetical protein